MAVSDASTLAPAAPAAEVGSGRVVTTIAAGGLFLAIVWAEIINHLQVEWSQNPQYHYAWSVPFLAAYLFWKRWIECPPAEQSGSSAKLILIGAALLLFPLRFVAEANPDWRLLSWGMTSIGVTITLALLYMLGGRPWLKHFAFPILFVLVAVPWPMQFEQAVIQTLMRAVTAVNVFFLSVAGVPALQHGNVIEVRSGLIGIEEACSGVRSLQATLMVSLFLGEFYSFSLTRRVVLVVAGAVLAFLCNLARTAILVWLGAQHGANSLEAWHDPAGLTILLVCLFGLWGISLLMLRGTSPALPIQSSADDNRRNPFPIGLIIGLTGWMLVAELAVQGWYRSHESAIASNRWRTQWPEQESGYQRIPIPPATQGILRYDDGGGASWSGTDSRRWMMYFFRWLPGRTAALFVKIHRPDVCLPASGLTMTRDDGIQLIAVNGINLPVRWYRFDDHGVPLHVVYCYWDARSSYDTVNTAIEEDWSARGRIRAALRGRREIGAQMLELVVWGYHDDEEARKVLERELGEIVRAQS